MTSDVKNPAAQALGELMSVASATHRGENAWLYALSWLAAGRLVASEQMVGATKISDLLSPAAWDCNHADGIPPEARAFVFSNTGVLHNESSMHIQCLSIVTKLVERYGDMDWDLIDAPWFEAGGRSRGSYSDFAFAPELCNLAFDVLSAPPQSTVWIPFDATGQLVIRAVRRGLNVIAVGPGQSSVTHLKLLLAIERRTNQPIPNVRYEADRGSNQKRELSADYLIATPPLGMRIQPGTGWRQWEGTDSDHTGQDNLYQRHGPITQVQLDRSDSWTVAAFWPRVARRAIFLVSPNVLFAKGQEQRLREHLLTGKCPLSIVTVLPIRQLSMANIPSAMLVLDRDEERGQVRMIDASDMTIDSKSTMRYSRTLDLRRVAALVTGESDEPKYACTVNTDEIAMQDFNLMPARYLRATLLGVGGPRQPLGSFVTVVRAPVALKDPTAILIQEAGFPELDRWRAVAGPFAKTTTIHPRKLDDSMLRPGDVLLSIKGTLGKSALIGAVPMAESFFRHPFKGALGDSAFPDINQAPVVPSQSCIALRIVDRVMNPVILLLYLRSDDFKNQIDSLRVGATVAHVTPATLLQDIQFPVLPQAEQEDYVRRYAELCELEASIEQAQQRTEEIRQKLWPADV
jgi:type I restriction-modification system DNA methylase subunit